MDPFKRYPCQAPLWAPGKEPLPPGFTEEDRAAIAQQQKYQNIAAVAMESCAVKTVMAGTMGESQLDTMRLGNLSLLLCSLPGFGIGALISLMSASFAYEDPLLRQQSQAGMKTTQKASQIFKEMGRGMYTSGRGFGKVGALFAGIECCIEGVCSTHFPVNEHCLYNFSIARKTISGIQYHQAFLLAASLHGTRDPRQLSVVVSHSQLSLQ
jgi:hypothetical protein